MRLDISSYDIYNLKPITNGRHKGNFGACYLFYGDAIKIIDVDKDVIKKIDVEKRLKEVDFIKYVKEKEILLIFLHCFHHLINLFLIWFSTHLHH